MTRLADRAAIVTGSSRGIGLAIARRLVEEGARVCLTGRTRETLDAAVAELSTVAEQHGTGVRVIGVAGKSHDPADRAETIARTIEAFGRLDTMVNNSGTNFLYGPLLEMPLDTAAKIMELNVISALAWVQEAHAAWLGEHGGSVVNMASVAGLYPGESIGFYGSSKAALIHLTRQLAYELAPTVRVNAVAPAVVKTGFATPMYDGREEDVASHYAMKRLGVPDDVAGAVAFLASDDAAWITGEVIVIDGGLTLRAGV